MSENSLLSLPHYSMRSRYPDSQRDRLNQYQQVGSVNEQQASDNSERSLLRSATSSVMPELGAALASDCSPGVTTIDLDQDTMYDQHIFATTLSDIKHNVQVNERLLRDLIESLQMWVFEDKPPCTEKIDQTPAVAAEITMQCTKMGGIIGQLIDSRMESMEQSMKNELTKLSINLSIAMKKSAREPPNKAVDSSCDAPSVESRSHSLDKSLDKQAVEIIGKISEGMAEMQTQITHDISHNKTIESHHDQDHALGMKVQRARLTRHMKKLVKARESQNLGIFIKKFVYNHILNNSFSGFLLGSIFQASHGVTSSQTEAVSRNISYTETGSQRLHLEIKHKCAWCFARSACLKNFVESTFFSLLSMVMILSNATWIAISDDYHMKESVRGKNATPEVFDLVNIIFTAMFTCEITLRLAAHRCNFFFDWDWRYNVFDLLVVLIGLLDTFTSVGMKSTMLRVVRILRVLRMFNVVRSISFFAELQQLLCAVTTCARTLIWTLSIFSLVSFMCAITCMEILLSLEEKNDATMTAKAEWFSSFWKSMETVVMIATFGVDWRDVVSPVDGALLGVIMFFVMFMAFVFMPIIVGTHAMRVTNFQKYEPSVCIQRKFQDADTFIEGLKARCNAHGYSMHERVPLETLGRIMDDHDTEQFLLAHELEFQISDVFNFFDLDDMGTITVQQFVYGCHFLTVAASATDSFFLAEQLSTVAEIMSVTKDRVKTIERILAKLQCK